MSFIQRQHSFVKFLIYLVIIFLGGFMLSIILGLILSRNDDIDDWIFTVSYILAFLVTAVIAIVTEHNALFALKERALALKKDISAVQTRAENMLFQLENLMITHMEHEKDMYLQKDITCKKNKEAKGRKKKFNTMTEIRNSISSYPSLRSDENVARLFGEIVNCHDQLMHQKTLYNSVASQYNAGTQKVLAKIFGKSWKLEKLEYYDETPDTLVAE